MGEQNSTMRIKMLPCKVCFLQKKKREEIEDDCDLFSVVILQPNVIKIVTNHLFDEYLITASS